MTGASIETTLELWASSLRDVEQRMRPLFSQDRVAASAGQFLDGLLGNEPRKTGWMRAEAAGDPGPWRQQAMQMSGARSPRHISEGAPCFFLPGAFPAASAVLFGKHWRTNGCEKQSGHPYR
jgi:hypothetical protein